ncbi:APC family permease [Pseudomonas sp. KNUC1026]|uniref:APC family permease n=1 Tax=Pseudomonas sp. KNUC1026 TaxID=2893890 RepID=UPI001F369BE3|nr:APC family permease [Pseudomonas sp. KNUC1026]UFH51248.1 APC family permease [Pseudomonas sp. KNUC1026]
MSVPACGGSSTELRRGTLGAALIVFFVVSAASPLSVIAGGFPIGIMLGNGPGTPALLVVTLAVLLLFAAGYTAMARHVTHAGGFYAIISHGLGSVAGGASGILAMLAYNVLQAGIYGLFGTVVAGNISVAFGIDVPWWACSLAALALIAWFGYRNVDLSARLLAVVVIAEYLAMLLLDVAILAKGGAQGVDFSAFQPVNVQSGTPSIGLLFCFAAFIGFEATTLYGEEAKNPKRTIPLATYVSVLLIGGFYTLSVWAMVVGAGSDKIVALLQAMQDPTTFVYSLSDHYVGSWLTTAIRLLFMFSLFAGLLAFHNAAARYFFAVGRDGLLPKMLGATHRRHQSPHMGSVLQTVIAAVILVAAALLDADPVLQLFSWFSNLATLCLILLMAMTSLAVVGFFRKHPELEASRLSRLYLPLVSGAALFGVWGLALLHFDVLTGASSQISYGLCAAIPVALMVGMLLASRQKQRSRPRRTVRGLSNSSA